MPRCACCGASGSAERGTPFAGLRSHPDYGQVCYHCFDSLKEEEAEREEEESDKRGGYDCDHPDFVNGVCVVCHERE